MKRLIVRFLIKIGRIKLAHRISPSLTCFYLWKPSSKYFFEGVERGLREPTFEDKLREATTKEDPTT